MTEEINYTASTDGRSDSPQNPDAKQEFVGDMLEELEAKGVQWSELLSILANVAQLRGQHELAQLLASTGYKVSHLEANG